MAARHELAGGARHRAPVDAVVRVEAAVLVAEQHRQIARIDLAGGRRQPPAAVGQGEGAQQPAVAVDDDRRAEPRRREVERAEAFDIGVPRRRPAEAEDEDQRAEGGEEAAFASARLALIRRFAPPSPASGRREEPLSRLRERGWGEGKPQPHFVVTSIAPNAVRPKRSGRYMSSAVAGG